MGDSHRELGEFLRRARAHRDPRDAGLPPDGRARRVPGLRREEVALLAGVSADYYTRLEQGRRIVPSTQVMAALAAALDLDEAGKSYLHALIGAAGQTVSRPRQTVQRVRPELHQLLDSFAAQPALILGRRTDVLAANPLARALFADFDAMAGHVRNYARWILLDEQAQQLFVDWEAQARNAVEALRLDAASLANDRGTQQLIGGLSLASPAFRQWWSEHQVHQRTYGTKRLRHPVVGELTVHFETLILPGDAHQVLYLYSTEPGSSSREALGLLASWSHPAASGTGPDSEPAR